MNGFFARRRLLELLMALSLVLAWTTRSYGAPQVILAPLSGTVGVQMEQFVERVLQKAQEEKAPLVIFELDTPGGLVEATRGITRAILASDVPVVMWVSPGGRAASAGAFMMQAAHVAAMASGTNMGAAHPVVASGGDVPKSDMKEKITNDLMAQMRALTQMRCRNGDTAQKMIEDSLSLTAQEALDENVIDLIADDLETLLVGVNGRSVVTAGRTMKVKISPDSFVRRVEMTMQERLIQFLSSPDIAYLLLVGGLMALFYEVVTPGGFVLGIIGALMLLMGSVGLRMLPFNWAGVALVGAGVIVMGLDILLGGMGVLILLGLAVITAGGLFLFKAPGGELLHISIAVFAGMVLTLGACFTFFAMKIARTLRSKISTGQQGLVGLEADVSEELVPEGMVRCRGELWRARTEGKPLKVGAKVRVVAVEGITLLVKEEPEGEEAS
ncbi:MAG: nodulation protein NfeD [Fretibacterium sp.]|nr:nodulation protein NfeD [Fretibacterium sp.]